MADGGLRILLIGNGGREHTLAWKLAQSARVECIHVVPGNGGTASLPKCTNIPSIPAEDFPSLLTHAKENKLNFLLPGPEAPLVSGIVDFFAQHAPHIHSFGPSQAAAALEGSKTFSKDFMARNNIPTARYRNCTTHSSALEHLHSVDYPIVIKASGLAAGKGVILPSSPSEAETALKEIMLDRTFGSAGDEVVIEERLEGEEISILSFSDGETILSLPPAQDHKRIGDGDTGPNTGGMGTYAPTPFALQSLLTEIDETILKPTITALAKEGIPFRGCLFTGLMLTAQGPRVLEYNVRFGDPETQSLLPLLESDLAEVMLACCTGTLSQHILQISPLSAATVVIAASGYPGSYAKGTPMTVQEVVDDGCYLFHAGTAIDGNGELVTSGGRVLAATATGKTLTDAVDQAYKTLRLVRFEGMTFRRDIAHRALPKGESLQRGIFAMREAR